MTDLARIRDRALEIALTYEGEHETPPGSNDGPMIRAFLAAVGVHHPAPWCAAFVGWCYQRAAALLGVALPTGFPVTGLVHAFWGHAAPLWGFREITPAAIACHDSGHGLGHMGIVVAGAADGLVTTFEGNTDRAGSRTGGSAMHQTRPVGYWNLGFVDIGRGDP